MNVDNTIRWHCVPGDSQAARALNELVRQVAPTDASVFITGESGTGKEVVAEVIHARSSRASGPFIALNCGAISPNLIESELFGHERGSFTGAVNSHRGHFERADGGTLFLDEITEMPVELQVKLLRVLETGRFMRVGSQAERHSDVRIVAATNRSPEEAIATGALREDLYYRLQVFPIRVPPLRERQTDVEVLAQFFLDELNEHGQTRKYFAPDALAVLKSGSWPGNVRQLKNAIHRAYILSGVEIRATAVEADHGNDARAASEPIASAVPVRIGDTIADVERRLIMATLQAVDGNKGNAAKMLGVSVKTLYNRLRSYRDRGLISRAPDRE